MTPGRRSLRFERLEEIVPDVERLLEGHSTVGQWSLAQICRHLSQSIRYSIDLPARQTPVDPSRAAELAKLKQAIFEAGAIPEQIEASRRLIPPENLDPRSEADRLRDALAQYLASPGPAIDHPVLGPLTKEEWDRAVCIHAAHHLSFAIPTGD